MAEDIVARVCNGVDISPGNFDKMMAIERAFELYMKTRTRKLPTNSLNMPPRHGRVIYTIG